MSISSVEAHALIAPSMRQLLHIVFVCVCAFVSVCVCAWVHCMIHKHNFEYCLAAHGNNGERALESQKRSTADNVLLWRI